MEYSLIRSSQRYLILSEIFQNILIFQIIFMNRKDKYSLQRSLSSMQGGDKHPQKGGQYHRNHIKFLTARILTSASTKEKDSHNIICAIPLIAHSVSTLYRTQCTESQHEQAFVKKSELTVTWQDAVFSSYSQVL